ncbi:MAG: DNA polymerase III subunit beta, partial [Solirubrobacterales bacterium]|nr:DNA polymerase III subunit beta [Solirubrobacterales bacterium]
MPSTSISPEKGTIELKVDRHALLEGLQSAARIASAKTSITALSGVQLAASATGIELRATDLELSLRLPLKGEVVSVGEVVLPARLFTDVVRALPNGQVSLKARSTKQDVEIKSGSATFDLKTLRAEDFPTLPEAVGDSEVTLPAEVLDSTIKRVERAASSDPSRPVLTGVLVQAEGTSLKMVATDSYRLSVKETELSTPLTNAFEANVPARALQEAVRLAKGVKGDVGDDESGPAAGSVRIVMQENQIVFDLDGTILASRLIDGQFPKYAELIPDSFDHAVKLSASELLDVVRRISLLAQRTKPLTLSFEKGSLTIS